MRPSTKDINYETLFEVNFDYYRRGSQIHPDQLDNINYYINPLIGGVILLRFENSKSYMKRYLGQKHSEINQIVLDYLYDNHKRWDHFQLVIPTVSMSEETLSHLPDINVATWTLEMKEAVLKNDTESGARLHKQLLNSLMNTNDLTFDYKTHMVKDKMEPIDYIHLIAQASKHKRTVNLTRLLGGKEWDPRELLLTSYIIGM